MARGTQWLGWAKGVAGVTIVAGLGLAYYHFQPVPRDEETLCVKSAEKADRGIIENAHYVFILDKTDKWTTAQASRLRSVVTNLRDQLALNERLSIFIFENVVERGFRPIFTLCNPGRGSDTTFLTSNPRRWEIRFNREFGAPLDEKLDELTSPTEGPLSPILEVLIDLTNREELYRRDIPRTIVLVSDMLQNSDAYTFFPRPPAPATPPASIPPSVSPPMGGPFIPMQPAPRSNQPLPLSNSAAKQTNASKSKRPSVVAKSPALRKLTAKEAEDMVERKGGLRHLRKFKIEAYQIRGLYSEEKLQAARQFWDLIAEVYGTKIDWKIL